MGIPDPHLIIKLILSLCIASQFLNYTCTPKELRAEESKLPITGNEEILIERLEPDMRGGQAYRLAYSVSVPVDIYWRFKTDFENDFLLENKFILNHRLISRENNSVITENIYTNKPRAVFKWKTTFSRQDLKLHFVLLNPKSNGHEFHYGYISLNPKGNTTQVVQEAYFDFFGASWWALYPWTGGMKDFLRYTARWEYDMVLKLYDRYNY